MEFDVRNIEENRSLLRKKIRLAVFPAIVLSVIMWLIYLVDYSGLIDFNFSRLGVYPLKLSGIWGVVFSPFIHASFSHLLSNTIPLIILMSMLFYFYSQIAFRSLTLLWLLSGIITWFIGRSSFHVGASGLVFALVFFLFFSGLLRRHIPLAAVSMIVAFVYGGTVWSMFPVTQYIDVSISWEAHLAGAVAGLIVALLYRKQGPQKPVIVWEDEEPEEEAIEPLEIESEVSLTANDNEGDNL